MNVKPEKFFATVEFVETSNTT
jgi:hypothetical protein